MHAFSPPFTTMAKDSAKGGKAKGKKAKGAPAEARPADEPRNATLPSVACLPDGVVEQILVEAAKTNEASVVPLLLARQVTSTDPCLLCCCAGLLPRPPASDTRPRSKRFLAVGKGSQPLWRALLAKGGYHATCAAALPGLDAKIASAPMKTVAPLLLSSCSLCGRGSPPYFFR